MKNLKWETGDGTVLLAIGGIVTGILQVMLTLWF